jgi:hypothetical protein
MINDIEMKQTIQLVNETKSSLKKLTRSTNP